jgi:hypothetical protein
MSNPTSRDLQTSIRRTLIPGVMGWVASLPLAPFIDQAELERALVVVLAGVYYAGLRWLEDRGVDAAGWWIAFGRTPQPHYFDKET